MKTAVEMTGIGRRFGPQWILSGIDLSLRAGESVALFGNNGSGKSTLLKIIATLLAPSTGRFNVLGFDGRRQKREIRNRIRFLSHEKQLYPSLTVWEHLQFAAGVRGISPEGSGLEAHLERLQIREVKDRPVSALSEGMKKRLVLARLLLGDSDLILLDEPHPTLDADGRRILNELIAEWRRQQKTILLASHDHEQALAHADRLLVLENGTIQYDGVPR